MAYVSSLRSAASSCMRSPIGSVKVPINGWFHPLKMQSCTQQDSLGQYNGSTGRGIKNFIVVFNVGFAPGAVGIV
jgi:hypothetical protein